MPNLRLAIPNNYPNGAIQVVRAQLDLDSYFYDDLQNTIHQHLSRGGLHSVTDYLNAWVGLAVNRTNEIFQSVSVTNYYSTQNNPGTLSSFDDLFNYDLLSS